MRKLGIGLAIVVEDRHREYKAERQGFHHTDPLT